MHRLMLALQLAAFLTAISGAIASSPAHGYDGAPVLKSSPTGHRCDAVPMDNRYCLCEPGKEYRHDPAVVEAFGSGKSARLSAVLVAETANGAWMENADLRLISTTVMLA